jgi:hypothetical protein
MSGTLKLFVVLRRSVEIFHIEDGLRPQSENGVGANPVNNTDGVNVTRR